MVYLLASPLNGIKDSLRARYVDSHRLFRDDIAPKLQSTDNVGVVCSVDCGDDDLVWLGLLDHAVKVQLGIGRHFFVAHRLQPGVCIIHAHLVRIAKTNNAGRGRVVLGNGSVKEDGSAASANNGVALLSTTTVRYGGHFDVLRSDVKGLVEATKNLEETKVVVARK